jgi:DNA-binding response OmpR family regulator
VSATILVIDDDPDIAAVLSIRLRAAGYRVRAAGDGATGIALAVEERPDLIVLDVRLPDLDGFQVKQRLDATPGLSTTPVVFVTANTRGQARRRAVTAGAAGFLSKPYEPAKLLSTIASLLSASSPSLAGESTHDQDALAHHPDR